MLLVKTKISISNYSGLGLFAEQNIKANATYWIRNELFDKVFAMSDFNSLPKLSSLFIAKYGFLESNNKWYLCGDNARFSNHSDTPNTSNHFDKMGILQFCTANRDIAKGEEIFIDYTEICLTCQNGVRFETVL